MRPEVLRWTRENCAQSPQIRREAEKMLREVSAQGEKCRQIMRGHLMAACADCENLYAQWCAMLESTTPDAPDNLRAANAMLFEHLQAHDLDESAL